MAKRLIPVETACPLVKSMGAIGDWLSFLIVLDACKGPQRFDEFQTNLGLARKVLSERLRSLVACGVFETDPASDGAHREYVLTQKGLALLTVVFALCQLGVFASGKHRHPTLVGGGRGQADCRVLTRMKRWMGWGASCRNTTASEMPKTAAISPSNVVKSRRDDALAALLIKPRDFRSRADVGPGLWWRRVFSKPRPGRLM
jgi:DNA-binding HxlR family transcriptional regulator